MNGTLLPEEKRGPSEISNQNNSPVSPVIL